MFQGKARGELPEIEGLVWGCFSRPKSLVVLRFGKCRGFLARFKLLVLLTRHPWLHIFKWGLH